MPSLEVVILAPAIVLVAYLIFGISGFGSTIIALPLLAHLMPLKLAIPLVVVLDCIGALSMGLKLRADVLKSEFVPMLPFLIVGLFAGAFVLLNVPTRWLLLGLGGFVLIFGANYLIDRKSLVRLPKWSVAPIGLFAGITSSAFGIGGPIYVFYFTARGATPAQVRATVPAVFSFTTVARIAIFGGVGLFNLQVLMAVAALLPVMALGMWSGHRLHGRLSREQVIRVVGILLLISGTSLVIRALAA